MNEKIIPNKGFHSRKSKPCKISPDAKKPSGELKVLNEKIIPKRLPLSEVKALQKKVLSEDAKR